MPLFKYEPYYQYNGPTRSQPFRQELEKDEIDRNMNLFFTEIGMHFADVVAKVERLSESVVGISSEITQDDCDARVKKCLNSLDLFANKIPA